MIKSFRRWIFENRRVENVESLKDWINQESQFQTIACETERTVFIVFWSEQEVCSSKSTWKRTDIVYTC